MPEKLGAYSGGIRAATSQFSGAGEGGPNQLAFEAAVTNDERSGSKGLERWRELFPLRSIVWPGATSRPCEWRRETFPNGQGCAGETPSQRCGVHASARRAAIGSGGSSGLGAVAASGAAVGAAASGPDPAKGLGWADSAHPAGAQPAMGGCEERPTGRS